MRLKSELINYDRLVRCSICHEIISLFSITLATRADRSNVDIEVCVSNHDLHQEHVYISSIEFADECAYFTRICVFFNSLNRSKQIVAHKHLEQLRDDQISEDRISFWNDHQHFIRRIRLKRLKYLVFALRAYRSNSSSSRYRIIILISSAIHSLLSAWYNMLVNIMSRRLQSVWVKILSVYRCHRAAFVNYTKVAHKMWEYAHVDFNNKRDVAFYS